MSDQSNIRIVDIARMADVSAGTVDRVLHNRGRVAPEKRERIEQIMREIDYQPNIAASFLASGKSYRLAAITPTFSSGDYWELVSGGIDRAAAELGRFNVGVKYFRFNQYDRASFVAAVEGFGRGEFDGVLIATLFGEHAKTLSAKLDSEQIPYIYIDADIPAQRDLAYFGGDLRRSGRIAARLLLSEVGLGADIFFAHVKFRHRDISVQMREREEGFMEYLGEVEYIGRVHHVEIDPDQSASGRGQLAGIIGGASGLVGGIVLNSRIYELVALVEGMDEALSSRVRLIGHDAIERNVAALKAGRVASLLSQRPELQGYDAVKALGNYFLFGRRPDKVNYMPIDILIAENVDYNNNYKL